MNNNGPISVSAPGVSLIGAAAKDITFSTRYPFAKLDSTNPRSFELLTIFFNNEPPNPAGPGTSNQTLVYSYPHGYTYTPSSWFLMSVDNFQTVVGQENSVFYNPGSGIGLSTASMSMVLDDTNVNIYVNKTWSNFDSAPQIIGYFVTIRAYIFVEDLTGTSVPSHA